MNAYLDHIDRLNPVVNAIVSLQARDGLLKQANARDDEGAAWGEYAAGCAPPHAIEGPHPRPRASAPRKARPLQGLRARQADAIMKWSGSKAAGAIIIGKTSILISASARTPATTRPDKTLNAYDQSKTAGRSGSGAGRSRSPADAAGRRPARTTPARCAIRPPGTTCSASAPPATACRRKEPDMFTTPGWAMQGPMALGASWIWPCLLSVQSGYSSARYRCRSRNDPSPFAQPLDTRFSKTAQIAWSSDFRRADPVRAGRARSLRSRAPQDLRGAGRNHREGVARFPQDRRVFPTWRVLCGPQSAGTALKGRGPDPARREMMKPEARFEVESGQKLSAYEVYDASVAALDLVPGQHEDVLRQVRLLHPHRPTKVFPVRRLRSTGRRPSPARPWMAITAGWR